MTTLRAATATDPGHVRATNQDMALIKDGLVAVADGMGGHAGGEVAAATAVQALADAFDDTTLRGLVAATVKANEIVYEKGERETELRGMGTTLTAAALVEGAHGLALGVINVGDSRAYLYADGVLRQLTQDHSLVEEMVRQGEISTEEAAIHPHRHILTRALGIDSEVEVDSWEFSPPTGVRLLLCSDGLTNECNDDEISTVLAEFADPDVAARTLVERALGHGGSDNVTVIVADVDLRSDEGGGEASSATRTSSPKSIDLSTTASPQVADATKAPSATAVGEPAASTTRSAARTSAPQVASPPIPSTRAKAPRTRSPRGARFVEPIVTFRVVAFVVALCLVVGGAIGVIVWFNDATYYVGVDGTNVAIYNGRPTGLLWMHPTLVEDSTISVSSLLSSTKALVQSGILESSFPDAKRVVTNLANEHSSISTTAGNS